MGTSKKFITENSRLRTKSYSNYTRPFFSVDTRNL